VSLILFTVYLSGLFGYVEEKVPNVKALSFVDDAAWTAEGIRRTSSADPWSGPQRRLRNGQTPKLSPSTRRKRRRSY